jgi:hypothetical protein
MSYYIGATGEYIWEELLENTTSNVIIANNINLDAGPLSDALQDIITDAAGTALGDLIGETTQVPSALGQALITLSSLGLLAYNKLNRTAVQDVDSMVYSADYASILTPGMFDDRVRIRYDTNYFSNAFYYVGGVKKGEILTSRINLLPVDTTNTDLYTLTGKVGIGIATPATPLHIYNATNNILRLQTAPVDGTNSIEFVRGSTTDPLNDYRLHTDTTGKFKVQYTTNAVAYGAAGSDLIHISPTNINLYKDTEITGKLGIGTSPATNKHLHIFNTTNPTIRIEGLSNPSIEFIRGTDIDTYRDYRFINDTGNFKLQLQNQTYTFGDVVSDIMIYNDTKITNNIPTQFNYNVGIGTAPHETYKFDVNGTSRFTGNVGINTTPHETYKLDILGTANATAFRGNGAELTNLNATNFEGTINNARLPRDIIVGSLEGVGSNITNINATNIATGQINLDRITLTAAKLYPNFNTTNFAIIDNLIDLPPNYSFTITGYDSQTLFNPSADRKYKGRMSCSYDDRSGVYKLLTTENKTDNVAVLQYKVGDKITIRNLANPKADYLLYSGFKYFNSLYLVKRPNTQPVNWNNVSWQPHMYEWRSGDGLNGTPEAYIYKPGEVPVFPFTTPITFIIETGFNYYLFKLYNEVDTAGGNVFIRASGYGDDFNDFNRAFGAGQTFKLQTGTNFNPDDYMPKFYVPPKLEIGSIAQVGGVKPRRGLEINAETGDLDAVPLSSDLITNMNTTHFTNNTGTSKIDISSSYVAPNATKLATARNIAGVSFDGTGNIDIPYANLSSIPSTWGDSQIPNLGAGKITSGTFSTDRIPDLGAGKITSGTFADARIPDLGAGKITSGTFSADRIPDLGAGKITSGTFDVLRIPDLGAGKITSGTFSADRIPDLGAGKITSGTFDVARIPNLDTGKITTGTFADARIPNLDTGKITTGTFADARIPSLAISKITGLQGALDGKAPTTHTHIIGDTTGLQTALDGKAPTSHTHTIANVSGLQTALDGKQATLTAGTGITISGATISATSSASYWALVPSTTNISYSTGNVGIGTSPTNKLHIYDETTNETKLIIQNNTILTAGLPTLITIEGATGDVIGTTERYISFPYSGTASFKEYTLTTTENLICDILIIGGGGAGGDSMGAGGGAGGVFYVVNQTLPIGTYIIGVGRGGIGGSSVEDQGTLGADQDGVESYIKVGSSYLTYSLGGVSQQLRGLGGGGGGVYFNPSFVNGRNGGSGGGCAETNNNGFVINTAGSATQPATYWNGTAYVVGGKAGRQNTTTASDFQGGGGGGLGNVSTDYRNGNDGVAISITGITPVPIYAAGGGAGQYIGASTSAGLGGSGIGGNGRVWTGSAYAAAPRDVATSGANGTGSGGGGTAYVQAPASVAGSGGSGIVIIRYRRPPSSTSSSSSIELVRGTTTDASVDYSVGNYDSSFKIKSVSAGTPTDRMTISSAGNVDIAGSVNIPTGSTYKINGVDISTTFTPTSANTIGIFNSSQFENVSSAIQIKSSWKPSGVVLADTATILATSRTIAGVAFNGSADIAIDYFGLNNKPISLIPSTTNLQLSSGYNLLIPDKLGVATTASVNNVLQVGSGGRLRIANANTDYTLIGTNDTDGSTNTSIVISGSSRANNAGNIQYVAVGTGGSHIFYTSSPTTTRMTISSAGVNINDNLAMVGRTGFGTQPHATYRVDVNGTLNATSILVGNNPISGSRWTTSTDTTRIYYNGGNVGIGTTNPANILQVGGGGRLRIANSTSDLTLIGTDDVDGVDNSRIVISGKDRGGTNTGGSIEYVCAREGRHIFYTWTNSTNTIERMRLDTNGQLILKATTQNVLRLEAQTTNNSCYIQFTRSSGAGNCFIGLDGAGLTGDAVYYYSSLSLGNRVNGEPIRFYTTINNVFTEPFHIRGAALGFYIASGLSWQDDAGRERMKWFGNNQNSYRGYGDNPHAFHNAGNTLIAYLSNAGYFWSAGGNNSDTRIKKEILDIDDDSALQMILAIEPKTYKYIDEKRGTSRVYGFIAQQIRSVIPEATELQTDFIPNIMKTAVCDKNKVYLDLTGYDDIPLNDDKRRVNIILGDGRGENYKIIEVNTDYFVVDKEIYYETFEDGKTIQHPLTEVFVSGWEVNNFHKLKKDYIFTLNVCATQELHRRIISQEERIKELETKMTQILNYISI